MRVRAEGALPWRAPILVGVLLLDAAPALAAPPRLPMARPEEVGMDAARLARIDAVVEEGLRAKNMPGCVVAIGRQGKLVLLRAYGYRQILPERVPMTTDTVFDMASLTKPVATATSVMILIEQGKVRLDDPAAKYIPEFGQNGKEGITLCNS